MDSRRRWLLCVLLAAPSLFGEAGSSPASDNATPTFKSSSRVVVVDVLVTDKQGNPVHDLKPQDFTLQEDGKAQQVRGLEERRTDGPQVAARPLNLPPDTYTNYVDASQSGALNIILFDRLNTDRTNLTIARQHLLQYLSQMPANSKVALYTLDVQLHLVHGFTADSRELIELAKLLTTAPHPMFSNARQASDYVAAAQELIDDPVLLKKTIDFIWGEQQGREESRTIATMEALAQLARSLAAVPGRKNLIWLSGGIPFDPGSTAPQMKHVAALFAATQIAVYPIDVRGVAYISADALASGKQAYVPFGGSFEDNSGMSAELEGVRESMMTMASLTGGTARYNNNDLSAAISNSIAAGSNYYILVYRPENNNWNGKFRKISVKTSQPNLTVHSRPGYYAVADPLGSADTDRAFTNAMRPDVPPSTTLIIKARVLPGEKTQIDTLVDVHDLALTETANHRRQADVVFVAAVWNTNGKPGGSDSATYRQPLSAEQLQSLLRTGLQLHQEMGLKPGSYQLRIGVLDRLSGKMGTLDVPLKIEATVLQEKRPALALPN